MALTWSLENPDEYLAYQRVDGWNYVRKLTLRQRFWKHVAPATKNGCTEWIGSRSKFGYGQIGVDDKSMLAHRLSFFLHHGYLPEVIMHTCDNPSCVNVAHLREGSLTENHKDMIEKGRHWQQRATSCRKGHPKTDENKNSEGACRACVNQRAREYRARQSEAKVQAILRSIGL